MQNMIFFGKIWNNFLLLSRQRVNEEKALRSELLIRCVKLTSIDSTFVISLPNPMFDHLLESSQ